MNALEIDFNCTIASERVFQSICVKVKERLVDLSGFVLCLQFGHKCISSISSPFRAKWAAHSEFIYHLISFRDVATNAAKKTRFVWSFIEFSQSSCRKVETVFLLARLFSVLVFLLLTSCCAYRTFSLPVSFFGLSFSLCGIRMGTFNAQFSSISGRCSTERL